MVGAIIGGLTGVASAAYSFYQADQESKAASAAALERAELRKKRDKMLDINYFEGLTYPMEAFDMAFEATLAQTKTAVEALQESDPRALAAGIGRVGAGATEQTTKTRQELADIAQKVDFTERQAKDAIKQQRLSANVADQSEEMMKQRDAEAREAALINQGMSGLITAGTAVGDEIDLYLKKGEDRKGKGSKKMNTNENELEIKGDSEEKKKKEDKSKLKDSSRFDFIQDEQYIPFAAGGLSPADKASYTNMLQSVYQIANPFM